VTGRVKAPAATGWALVIVACGKFNEARLSQDAAVRAGALARARVSRLVNARVMGDSFGKEYIAATASGPPDATKV
jgi:hypothetical protein